MRKGKERGLKTTFDFPLPNKEEEEYTGGNVERRSR